MKKTLLLLLTFTALLSIWQALGASIPEVNCGGLPCPSNETNLYKVLWGVIAVGIKYVAVIAVLAVMVGGIMYLVSSGEEEKTKRAKSIIIWALVGTFLSVSAWALVSIVNNFKIF